MKRFLLLSLLVLISTQIILANELARNAVSEDSALSAPEIEELSAHGPTG
jgi:hypothetical protein